MEDKQKLQKTVPNKLRDYFSSVSKAAIAFSGGVDSSYLLYAAKHCGVDVRAYFVHSQFQPRFELDDAKRLAGALDADIKIIPVDVLSDRTVAANRGDRCYHCKRAIFGTLSKASVLDGYALLWDGTNASDDAGDRPGMRALKELKVRSPLRETGLTKNQVREYSHAAGLFTWNKPAYACLATRLPTGTPLDADILIKVEQAEQRLEKMGFTDFRAKVLGSAVKLQLLERQIPLAAQRHSEILRELSPWFGEVLLDLHPRPQSL